MRYGGAVELRNEEFLSLGFVYIILIGYTVTVLFIWIRFGLDVVVIIVVSKQ